MTRRRIAWLLGVAGVPLLLALAAVSAVLLSRQGGLAPFRVPAGSPAALPAADAATHARGEYLATLGNCRGCHTAAGGTPYAGGRAFRTDWGTVYSSNLTPHRTHGLGDWSAEEFAHAMRHGVSRHGVLSPVFPYGSFRHLTDGDLAALHAYLRRLPSAAAPRRRAELRFPANLPGAMTAWRLLYYRPTPRTPPHDATLARGAYLVEGIGHCGTCHATRGRFASLAGDRALQGGHAGGWHAPALDGGALQRFAPGEVAQYLRGGSPGRFAPYGLMADVVMRNLQYLEDADAAAIEAWLRALPAPLPRPRPPAARRPTPDQLEAGRALHRRHCADCHGADGEGEPGRYPPLRGSSAIAAHDPGNLVKLVLFGAVAPATAAHPRPYTMPPFAGTLTAGEVAALANFLRLQADPDAAPLDTDDVQRLGGL